MSVGQLYYKFVSNDPETPLVSEIIVKIGIIYVLALSLIAIIIKSISIVIKHVRKP